MRPVPLAPTRTRLEDPATDAWFGVATERMKVYSGAADPTLSEVPQGQWIVYRNTTSGTTAIWANVNNTLVNITAGTQLPVGSVFTNTDGSNPATTLGYGTWASFGAGKVLAGFATGDPDFGTAGGTGGAKTSTPSAHTGTAVADHPSHTHTYTDVPNHTHTMQSDAGTGSLSSAGTHIATVPTTATGRALATATDNPTGGVATGTTAGPSVTLTHTVTQPNNHSAMSVLQPYIVVYFWTRTA